ncbi:MAG: hypothetical protein ACR2QI_08270 [Woeseiaceae bacterium]
MSTLNKGLRTEPAQFAKTRINTDKAGGLDQRANEEIEVLSLRIDESYGVECDPYNSTGQFLANAANDNYDD